MARIFPKRFDVVVVRLDPTQGSEMRKTRPCVIISPDEMNQYLRTVIVAPMTTTTREYPMRVSIKFQKKFGEIALDQFRAIDRERITRRLGKLSEHESTNVLEILAEMFAP